MNKISNYLLLLMLLSIGLLQSSCSRDDDAEIVEPDPPTSTFEESFEDLPPTLIVYTSNARFVEESTNKLLTSISESEITFSSTNSFLDSIQVGDVIVCTLESDKSINIESPAELHRVAEVAQSLNVKAPISVRVNPDVDPQTHPYISTGLEEAKFGVPMEQAIHVYREANTIESVEIIGIACHIGSQITTTAPFIDALKRVIDLVKNLAAMDIDIQHLDLGGGLGISYNGEKPPSPADYIQALLSTLRDADINLPISIEPGRAIAGNAGILVTRVEYLKSNEGKNFAIVDAAMNDLLRPSLYDAWHQIDPVSNKTKISNENHRTAVYDIVGPVCETGDILGKDRSLSIQSGDLLAIRSAGAYGFVMSSNYNTRPRAAEVIADKDSWQIVRRRETVEELYASESTLDD